MPYLPIGSSVAIDPRLSEKEIKLRTMLRSMQTVLIAFSGGVDSSYLAHVANQELGSNAVCVLGLSPSVSRHQRSEAIGFARRYGLKFETVETAEIETAEYKANASNRCYFCKAELYKKLRAIAKERGIDQIIDGTNADDLTDHRPGRAAAAENDVASPLADAGITKDGVRALSRKLGLPTWDRPASPCLSSRIAYGTPVSIGRLTRIEKGEELLRGLGFIEFRVRVHSDLARIEIAKAEFDKFLHGDVIRDIADSFKKFGFKYVTFDLDGFRSGSMNQELGDDGRLK